MNMPSTLYVSLNSAGKDCIDPRTVTGDDIPKSHYLRVHRNASDVAEEGTVYVARYKFLGLVAVTQRTERTLTVAEAEIPDFGCSVEAIDEAQAAADTMYARAEADMESAAINRLTGRDPHECVKCGAVDCVCKRG